MDSLLLESMKEAIVCFLLATIAAVIIVFITLFASVGINKLFLKSKEKINTDMNNVIKLHLYIEGEKKK
jgi:hypothetical protein|nr:MAG TPA: TM helix protein [Caudoviricetes sp.]